MSLPLNKNNLPDDPAEIATAAEEALRNGPPVKVPEQEVALIIVVAPEGTAQRNVQFGLMLLGMFPDVESAKTHTKRLQRLGYVFFDIFIVPAYRLLPLPPPRRIEDTNYFENELNQIWAGHKRNMEDSARLMQTRLDESRAAEKKAKDEHKQEVDNDRKEEKSEQKEEAADGKRYATEEERKRLKVVLGDPVLEAPPGAKIVGAI